MQRATFGAGCYWGTEAFFKRRFKTGIARGEVGFMGGQVANPTYRDVCGGSTGHAEVYSFEYDPQVVAYADLVRFFFQMHNSTTKNRQCGDVGTQYRSAVFYHSEEQRQTAQDVMGVLNDPSTDAGKKFEAAFKAQKIATTLEPASHFYVAHKEHQEYLDVNPDGYCSHRMYWRD